ncbi:hypothetical protein [Clostridium tertium]|uniref:hypothetical protein n=1 Tax=Clostridium tertium TaxID=1559 RepID=UPI0023B2F1CC|nr:hypothetical protein [Clostridium tertium]
MNTNLYMIANSSILTSTKAYLDEKYNSIVLYGTSTVEGLQEIYADINSMQLKSIIYIDSVFSKEELETTFDIIKDILVYINSDIKVFFIGNGDRGNIAKSRVADIKCDFFESNKKYTTRLLEEGVLFPLLKESPLDNIKEQVILEGRNQMPKDNIKPIDLSNIEVITVDTKSYSNSDNRHICLMQNIEKMIADNNMPYDNITNSLIGSIMSGELTDVGNIKEAINKETAHSDISREIHIALELIDSDIERIQDLIKSDPSNEYLTTQLIKLEQYHKNIKLNESKYQYTAFVRIMKETSEAITKEYTQKVAEVNKTTEKYIMSVNKIKEMTEKDSINDVNKVKIKKKIEKLKNYKNIIENELNNYIASIDLVYNGMQTSYIDAMHDIRRLILDAKTDLERLPSIQGEGLANNSTINGITEVKLHAIEQLSSDGKQLVALRLDTVNSIKTLLAHTDNINKGLRKIVSVLELIVVEQDKYINYIETQSKKRIMINYTQPTNQIDPYLDKVVATVGVNAVGKTGVTLSTAYAASINHDKKVAVVDLAYDEPQAMYYVENESFREDLHNVINYDIDSLRDLFNQNKFRVIKMDYLDILDEKDLLNIDSLKRDIGKFIHNLSQVTDIVFLILPQNFQEIKEVLDYVTRLIIITDLDASHYRGTTRIVDAINMYLLNKEYRLDREPLQVKYFMVNKCTGTIDLNPIKARCNIKDSEYAIKQFKHIDKILLSKNIGNLKIKDSRAILTDIDWLGDEMYG